MNRAKIKIGFPYKSVIRNLLLDAAVFRSDMVFEGECMLHALMLLGANPQFPLDYNWPKGLLESKSLNEMNSVIYFPHASVESKCWPPKYFYDLIELMAKNYPDLIHNVMAGVRPEENIEVYRNLTSVYSNVRCMSCMSLDDAAALIARARVVVSNDTGIRNLAISLDTATVGIFFSTVPFRYWPRNGKHEAIFLSDGSLPSVELVYDKLSKMLLQDSASKCV